MPDSPKPRLPPISTSKSATFPSELHQSPVLLSDRPDFIKQEDALLKTPITPPVAYIDFLKSVTPVLASPMKTASPVFSETSSGYSSPTSQPSTASSTRSCTCDIHKPHKLPAISIPPPSPFAHPRSARTPKSLHAQRIPASPATARSPMSASSPKSATCMSAWSQSQFSPSDCAANRREQYRKLQQPCPTICCSLALETFVNISAASYLILPVRVDF
ncbi:hypothetical protein ACO22_01984 [Paracoccidioides brasiliensis]|uniref:Uncharacterized protein n=1 Tax=Paracoccidioides brasiliensis TaxID=121759 RepID=A0A1D2JJY2_PARBR|nr:hypothetical protein ACO22_01984 [Paracoccidioides brasiliensis]